MKHGIDQNNLDRTVSPSDNFYQFADGGWKQRNPLRDEYSRYGVFDSIGEKVRKQLNDLVMNLSENPDSKIKDTPAQKVADSYKLFMDRERLDRDGIEPIRHILEKAKAVNRENLIETLAWLNLHSADVFMCYGVSPSYIDSEKNILYVGMGASLFGDRDYYIVDSERNREILAAYEKFVKRVMTLAGYDDASAQRVWETVIDVETRDARITPPREDRRDPMKVVNEMDMAEFIETFSGLDWKKYFELVGIDYTGKVNISFPESAKASMEIIAGLTDQQLSDYIAFNVVAGFIGFVSEDFSDASFDFYGRVLSGRKEKKPRWKRAMALVSGWFGEIIGQLYVERYFPKENKDYMVSLVENLRKSLDVHIRNLTWMSDATKEKALDKLSTLSAKIGYPDKWKDYSEIHIDAEKTLVENLLAWSEWNRKDSLSKLGQPVDREKWLMTPQTVNAYYSPGRNEICFPAAILQPPYFDITADDAVNYGAIGVVIGHEMTHAFDDQGRKYDKNGNLSDWWMPEDAEKFEALSKVLVDQFDEVEVKPGIHANGKFTLGENIADQGGLRLALTAWRQFSGGNVSEPIEGFSPLQQFYLSYASVWADNATDEYIVESVKNDPHSLGVNRVNVTLRNLDTFFEAFDIKEGDPMWRPEDQRVIIW